GMARAVLDPSSAPASRDRAARAGLVCALAHGPRRTIGKAGRTATALGPGRLVVLASAGGRAAPGVRIPGSRTGLPAHEAGAGRSKDDDYSRLFRALPSSKRL